MGYSEKGAIHYLDFVCKSDLLKKKYYMPTKCGFIYKGIKVNSF